MVPRPSEAAPVSPPPPTEAPETPRKAHEARKRVSVSSLASSVDSELLRAVPLNLVLAGCGKAWINQADEYHRSERVNAIDAFLSHDWGTRRWLKTATLLVYFNSVPAAVASLLMCILVCVLIIFRVLDGWLPGTLAIHGAYWFVFVYWQSIRGLYKKNMVFLDRTCIAQHDTDLKKQGILSLGGFLSKSRKLVVLWSPRYFTRLWTAFELSAFLREDVGRAKDILFAPASMGPLLLYFSVFETLLITSFHLFLERYVQSVLQEQTTYLQQDKGSLSGLGHLTVAMLVICAPAFLVIAPLVLYLGTMQMKALLQLRKQLDDFKIRHAQCSCCQMDHRHPDTGEEILCDRMLVFQTLKRWYPNETSSDAYLDRFDEMVHTKLGGFVGHVLGAGAPPLRHVVAITVHPLLGFLCFYVYLTVNEHLFPWSALGWMIGWFQAPPMVYLAFWEFLQLWRMGARFSSARCPLWLILFLGAATGIGFNVAVWLQYNLFKYTFGHDFNWPVVGSLIFMWVVFIIPYIWEYFPNILKQRRNGI